ncbi:hydroxymethylglutaryl-CoA synthase 1 [Cephus cinctus]|uniref:Hydroxymethylglutaryl-CoA synthase n=1 Tax=Cephus cinctus TaxID=211228 RepID=A0AAJ7BT63_CEPCN|nr:hydroxymethylglutaryl-CoA synthase 1 [Cephus cinctus]XP_015593679.1 hydroxymethylglutaryl-CoA synthase 1 [Cephus cinctus]XP_015593680.1 hydroxymethylglutaryl-CoA synthase 1 [Cephus cinctus]XP_024939954.1 hydroxymethylglutaryl-CoA synthase 1 [Cephus cinctus]XP_024939955.1 hydroxymethylglutaryl-CoA synthase 1 [Cephus cinctus]
MAWPKDIGIKALEIYFPAQYVDQVDLEKFDGVAAGKYTVGLGQSKMGFCNDREDINSLCLTVLQRLLDRNNIKPEDVGRLEVGTETILDKSKSVKTVLMQLFEPLGCTDIEGVDSTNACYGGTAALFNTIAWVESSSWDGRLAIVVAADNAVYASGNARPTGGAGAIAMAIGPNAPLVFDQGIRASCMRHTYDFYKPDLRSEYPVVDGKLSIQCYFGALDECYRRYCLKTEKKHPGETVSLNTFDALLFHSPYGKLVQKSFARLAFVDFLNTPKEKISEELSDLKKFHDAKLEETYFDRDIEKAFINLSKTQFAEKTQPSLFVSNLVGNMYTPSVYSGLVSLLINKPIDQLAGNKVGIFSYGSGFASSMYSLTITKDISPGSALQKMISTLSYVKPQLESRERVTPDEYTRILELREKNCHTVPYEPSANIEKMFPGTFYLRSIDSLYRRTYERVPKLD